MTGKKERHQHDAQDCHARPRLMHLELRLTPLKEDGFGALSFLTNFLPLSRPITSSYAVLGMAGVNRDRNRVSGCRNGEEEDVEPGTDLSIQLKRLMIAEQHPSSPEPGAARVYSLLQQPCPESCFVPAVGLCEPFTKTTSSPSPVRSTLYSPPVTLESTSSWIHGTGSPASSVLSKVCSFNLLAPPSP